MSLGRLEQELWTHDPIAQIKKCLSCPLEDCTDCISFGRYKRKYAVQRNKKICAGKAK